MLEREGVQVEGEETHRNGTVGGNEKKFTEQDE